MATNVKSFQIYNMKYDANIKQLTFEYDANGCHSTRVILGSITDEDIAANFKKFLNQYYTEES